MPYGRDGIVYIKLSDGIVKEFKDMRYVTQLKKNDILIGALEAQGLRGTHGEAFLRYSVAHWLF